MIFLFIIKKEKKSNSEAMMGTRSLETNTSRIEEDPYMQLKFDSDLQLLELETSVEKKKKSSKKEIRKVDSLVSSDNDFELDGDTTKTAKKSKIYEAVVPKKSFENHVSVKVNSKKTEKKSEKQVESVKENHQKHSDSSDSSDSSNDIGFGQLRSEVKHVGDSISPCTQDSEHSCIISVDSGHSLMSGPPDVIKKIKCSIKYSRSK